jgi:hypothetical protein
MCQSVEVKIESVCGFTFTASERATFFFFSFRRDVEQEQFAPSGNQSACDLASRAFRRFVSVQRSLGSCTLRVCLYRCRFPFRVSKSQMRPVLPACVNSAVSFVSRECMRTKSTFQAVCMRLCSQSQTGTNVQCPVKMIVSIFCEVKNSN